MKIRSSTIDVILLCLTFYELSFIPHLFFIGFKYIVLLGLFVKYMKKAKRIKEVLVIVGCYGSITVLSTIMNHMAFNTQVASFFFMIQIIDVYLVTEFFVKKYSLLQYSKIIFNMFFVLLVLNDGLMLVINYNFANPSEEYLIGSKFSVSYVHCFVSALSFLIATLGEKNDGFLKKQKIKLSILSGKITSIIYTLFSIWICYIVNCSTGMIICFFFLVLMLLSNTIKIWIADAKLMIIITAIINIAVFGSSALLSQPFFENIIYNVLGKSYTWRGRLIIWEKIFELIIKRPIIGYGYYNSIVEQTVGFGNPQNGILKILIDTGIIGLVLYTILILINYKYIKNVKVEKVFPLIAFYYAMVAASIVEINLTHMIVFLAMAMFYSQSNVDEYSTTK